MKIALLQMKLEPGSRSANLTAALKRIDEAADLTPAPDLICLPGCADHGGILAKAAASTDARGGAFCETLAMKARDLGLFIATGHADAEFDAVNLAASLLDSDGDAVIRQRAICRTPAGETGHGTSLRVRDTILGRVGLLVGLDLCEPCLPQALAMMGAKLLIVPGLGTAPDDVGKLARICGAFIAIAQPAALESGRGEPSAVYAPDGKCIAAAESGEEQMLVVDVAVPSPSAAVAG